MQMMAEQTAGQIAGQIAEQTRAETAAESQATAAHARLGLGLAALGRPGYINLGHAQDLGPAKDKETMRQNAWNVLDTAWNAGIRYFDAARSYGLAEQFLGEWLRVRGYGHSVQIGSKWGYTYVADWRTDAEIHEVKTHDLSTLERQWPETLAALGRSADLYLIHSVTPESGVLNDPGVLRRLAQLAQAGVRVGLSTSGPQQARTIEQALSLKLDGQNPLSAVQATWNLLEPSAGAALSAASAAGWTVVVKEALANGRLSSRGQEPQRAVLTELARTLKVTPDAVALAAASQQPWADVVLSGASTTAQLQQNLLSQQPAVQEAVQSALAAGTLAGLTQTPESYWRTRSALAWN